jgi:hypothetical protein
MNALVEELVWDLYKSVIQRSDEHQTNLFFCIVMMLSSGNDILIPGIKLT